MERKFTIEEFKEIAEQLKKIEKTIENVFQNITSKSGYIRHNKVVNSLRKFRATFNSLLRKQYPELYRENRHLFVN